MDHISIWNCDLKPCEIDLCLKRTYGRWKIELFITILSAKFLKIEMSYFNHSISRSVTKEYAYYSKLYWFNVAINEKRSEWSWLSSRRYQTSLLQIGQNLLEISWYHLLYLSYWLELVSSDYYFFETYKMLLIGIILNLQEPVKAT